MFSWSHEAIGNLTVCEKSEMEWVKIFFAQNFGKGLKHKWVYAKNFWDTQKSVSKHFFFWTKF